MPPRSVLFRTLLPPVAAVCGFIAGLVGGGLVEALLVPLALLATGHTEPFKVLDASFGSNPIGPLAFVMIAGYFTTAFLGAMIAYKMARGFSKRWRATGSDGTTLSLNPIRDAWRKCGVAKKILLVALPILTLLFQTVSVRQRQAAIRHSAPPATTEKLSLTSADHSPNFYAPLDQKRTIFYWEFASFLVTFGTLAYVFHIFRLKDLVLHTFAGRQNSHDHPGFDGPKQS
jgi:hypothetical protein